MARVNLGKVVPQKGVDYMTPQEKIQFETDITTDVENNIADYVANQKTLIDGYVSEAEDDFDVEVTHQLENINTLVQEKTTEFNTNATNKTTAFNTNATNKTVAFNTNSEDKKEEFDSYAEGKKEELEIELTDYSKIAETGSKIALDINSTTFKIKAILKDKNNITIDTSNEIDLPLESVVVGGRYDSTTKKVILTLENGNTVDFSVADLVSGLQTELSSSNKLPSDYVDTTNQANQFVTLAEKTTWNGKENANNKITTITSASTDTQYPSAKAVYDYINDTIGDINSILDNINGEVV